MALVKTKGLVVRSVNFGDTSKMLTILTDNLGKISVNVKGAQSLKRGINSCVRNFCFSEFVLYEGKSIYTLSSCQAIETFYDLSRDVERLTAASEILKTINTLDYDVNDFSFILSVSLNCLYMLAKTKRSIEEIFLVFNASLLKIGGVMPDFSSCNSCGENEKCLYLIADEGMVLCEECSEIAQSKLALHIDVRNALCFLSKAESKKMFSFTAVGEIVKSAGGILEMLLKYHH